MLKREERASPLHTVVHAPLGSGPRTYQLPRAVLLFVREASRGAGAIMKSTAAGHALVAYSCEFHVVRAGRRVQWSSWLLSSSSSPRFATLKPLPSPVDALRTHASKSGLRLPPDLTELQEGGICN